MPSDDPFARFRAHEDPPTEADNPVVDGAWDDNPFATGADAEEATRVEMSAFDPDAAPPAPAPSAQVSGLRMPPQQPQAAAPPTQGSGLIHPQQHAVPQPTHGSGLLQPPQPTYGSGLLQPPQPTQTSGLLPPPVQQPPQAMGPQVPLPDPRYTGLPAPKLPAPPGYGQRSPDPTSSISYTIDFILDALEPAKKRKRWILLAIVVLAVGGVAAWYFVGSSSVGDKIEADTPQEAEAEVGAPTWEELGLVATTVRTVPDGARLVVNGRVVEGQTPLEVQLVEGQPNTVFAYHDGHMPAEAQVDAGFDASAGLDIELAPVDASPVGYIKVSVADEDNGARVFIDGKDMGTAPVLAEELPLAVIHHIQVEREGKGPWVRIWRSSERREEVTAPPLLEGVYTDRNTELTFSVAPLQAKLLVDGQLPENNRIVRDWGQVVSIDADMSGRKAFKQVLHTTGVGSFRVDADLPIERLGQARVRWRVKSDDLKTCLVRPGRGFCWREDAGNFLVVDEGKWTVRVYEEQKDGSKKYVDDEAEITFAANQEYKVKVDIDDGRISLDPGKPKDWDGTEDGAGSSDDDD